MRPAAPGLSGTGGDRLDYALPQGPPAEYQEGIPVAKQIALILLGLAIGYFVGFADGRRNDRNIVVRVVERVGGAADRTVGARDRAVREEIERMNP